MYAWVLCTTSDIRISQWQSQVTKEAATAIVSQGNGCFKHSHSGNTPHYCIIVSLRMNYITPRTKNKTKQEHANKKEPQRQKPNTHAQEEQMLKSSTIAIPLPDWYALLSLS